MSLVMWQPWGPAAFERARTEHKPLLLSLTARWSECCDEMDRTTYADPAVATLINHAFVPIRVDADRRPDLGERYGLGGWPTTAFLNADGAILGGGTYVPVQRMAGILAQVASSYGLPGHDTAGAVIIGAEEPQTALMPRTALTSVIFESFDSEHGGFGSSPKFPLTAPLHLALALHRDGAGPRMAEIVSTSLDAMGWGPLYDTVDGGFFRCADSRDWQQPHLEKLLEVNAALLAIYVDAAETLDAARFAERAADVLRYTQTWLADPVDGGWAASQQASREYYCASTPAARTGLAPPAVDRVLYANANAAMVSAVLRAAALLSDDGLRDFALRSLERVLLACYKPGAGVAHDFDGAAGVRGLLDDQVAMAVACLDAFGLSENIVYEMMAEELAHFAVRTMWDEGAGGFFDRADDNAEALGLMRTRLKPFVANCQAAAMLRRLAATSGDHDFGRRADEALGAMEPRAPGHGPLAAHFALAVRSP